MSTQILLNNAAKQGATTLDNPNQWWQTTLLGGSSFTTLGGQRGAFAFADQSRIGGAASDVTNLRREQPPVTAEQAQPTVIEADSEVVQPDMWPIGQSVEAQPELTEKMATAIAMPSVEAKCRPSGSPAPDGSIDPAETQRVLQNLSRRFALTARRPAVMARRENAPVMIEPPPLPPLESEGQLPLQDKFVEKQPEPAPAAKTHGYHFAAAIDTFVAAEPAPDVAQPLDEPLSQRRQQASQLEDEEYEELRLKDYTVGFGELMNQPSAPEAAPAAKASPAVAVRQPRAASGYHIAQKKPAPAPSAVVDLGLPAAPPRSRPVSDMRVPNPNRKRKSWLAWLATPPPPDHWE